MAVPGRAPSEGLSHGLSGGLSPCSGGVSEAVSLYLLFQVFCKTALSLSSLSVSSYPHDIRKYNYCYYCVYLRVLSRW